MLDKRSMALLKIINAECIDSGYKVFSVEQLISSLPSELGVDENVFLICIKNLLDRDYISVKYQDENEICLVPLVKGRLVFENLIDEEIEKNIVTKKYFAFAFFGGIIGSFLASLVVALIKAVIIK